MWYDFFASFYDATLERQYAPVRAAAFDAWEIPPDGVVMDAACGTGQNFPFIQEHWKPASVLGVDLSPGMLRKAAKRVARAGWENVSLLRADVHALNASAFADLAGPPDTIVAALAFTLIPDWERAMNHCFTLLNPGGRFVILDVHARKRTFQTWSTELVSRGDLSRQVWKPLEQMASSFEVIDLPGSPRMFGGNLFAAMGTKPAP